MRGANRNKQTFWYALYDATVEQYDEYGNQIGTSTSYGNPIKARGNISPAAGSVAVMPFGADDMYDRIIGPLPIDTPIDEYAVLWIDVEPELDESGALAVDDMTGLALTPHNYIVKKRAASLPETGSVMLGVSKVSVS